MYLFNDLLKLSWCNRNLL